MMMLMLLLMIMMTTTKAYSLPLCIKFLCYSFIRTSPALKTLERLPVPLVLCSFLGRKDFVPESSVPSNITYNVYCISDMSQGRW